MFQSYPKRIKLLTKHLEFRNILYNYKKQTCIRETVPSVEEDVGRALVDVRLGNLFARGVVVTVPGFFH